MMLSDIVRDLPLIVNVFGNTAISGVFRAKGVESGEAPRPPGPLSWPECFDEKVDLGCEPIACFLCCGPAGSSCTAGSQQRDQTGLSKAGGPPRFSRPAKT